MEYWVATNRCEDDEEIIQSKPAEPSLALALPCIDAQAGSKNFKRNGDNVTSCYCGDPRAGLVRRHGNEVEEHGHAVTRYSGGGGEDMFDISACSSGACFDR